jgi:CheY-like chemotaxis protein
MTEISPRIAAEEGFESQAMTRANFTRLNVLLVDRSHYFRSLISQALRGFEVRHITSCDSGAAAQKHLEAADFDLCLIDAELPDMSGADLVRFIRRRKREHIRYVPVIMLLGFSQFRQVGAARDAGANLVLRKPISPKGLFDRIVWLARTRRPYVELDTYIGPDRKFHDIDPPDGAYKRAADPADARGKKARTDKPAMIAAQ